MEQGLRGGSKEGIQSRGGGISVRQEEGQHFH